MYDVDSYCQVASNDRPTGLHVNCNCWTTHVYSNVYYVPVCFLAYILLVMYYQYLHVCLYSCLWYGVDETVTPS